MHQPRGIFFDEVHALAAVGRLHHDGYDATLAREPDGWLDVPESPRHPPLELPTAPLRFKNPPAAP